VAADSRPSFLSVRDWYGGVKAREARLNTGPRTHTCSRRRTERARERGERKERGRILGWDGNGIPSKQTPSYVRLRPTYLRLLSLLSSLISRVLYRLSGWTRLRIYRPSRIRDRNITQECKRRRVVESCDTLSELSSSLESGLLSRTRLVASSERYCEDRRVVALKGNLVLRNGRIDILFTIASISGPLRAAATKEGASGRSTAPSRFYALPSRDLRDRGSTWKLWPPTARGRSTTRRRMGALTWLDGCIFNVTKIATAPRHSEQLFRRERQSERDEGERERERENERAVQRGEKRGGGKARGKNPGTRQNSGSCDTSRRILGDRILLRYFPASASFQLLRPSCCVSLVIMNVSILISSD